MMNPTEMNATPEYWEMVRQENQEYNKAVKNLRDNFGRRAVFAECKTAYANSEFGQKLLNKYFSPESIASVPVNSKGTRKGMIKGQIAWIKCLEGGFTREFGGGYVERRRGAIVAMVIFFTHKGQLHYMYADLLRDNKGIRDITNGMSSWV
jgi:hypothetical protein